ncbi:MAG: hypothetical protein K9J37_22685 [Saprospiraceae bacterium]|nr:hypothetical protein [Saprospiraceae bacterium]MCF8252732.1 hypothetical protein [Saprospiraceae bacterium]MCF8283024.1 hypothetical protein [Bacteroidales bacterium]MCF8314294.1 hypothetical protein [Saprospiraceae bacterium]MCF8443147.1 hypothetical protein [Saprospiraceae bacterium]
MKKLIALLPLCCLLLWQACSNDKTCATQPLNPNGDSELALLMRQMFEDGERVRTQIQKGEVVSIQVDFDKIMTAKATDPAKMQGPEFPHFAASYVEAMKALRDATPAEAQDKYTAMVATCMNCHEQSCPGPIVRIKKLL